ncbi:mycofactocin-associated electron transfer flavoprotein alpha subunit [Amycolatopsis cynarae]|uniref:Mycofactocin-associated electron transfer flavoprotein alpha subunit n=1 Tax=Amycolatopsis cynarae TaxID=2995223 RepID=A0ABY7B6A0_9PSEU|nr:mycofactocin-associated electron transfer flavoprotein alpha subunit [Amycolatopsis sp. HUAS 11-8]WAL67475.1 mycofactocin-associated electron transfer flavoprotein alpha subunit [Amycolatopsis sp. HUAS 11-8]
MNTPVDTPVDTPVSTVAVIVVRDGVLPLGADETVAEAGGEALLAGTGVKEAAGELVSLRNGRLAENGAFAPGRWARQLAAVLSGTERILLPSSPDGRDLAPRLAAELGRPLLPGAIRVTGGGAELARWDDRACVGLAVDGPFVATLRPGVRGAAPAGEPAVLTELALPGLADTPGTGPDVTVLEVLDPEPGTVDLAEAPRIFGAGAGLGHGELDGPAVVGLLGRVASVVGASVGATRVVTDAGWTGYQRQIGTTGVVVKPELYVAFGISGAAQHIGGLGDPAHVVSINLDPSCPMTAMADLGIVADAQAVLLELARMLEVRS